MAAPALCPLTSGEPPTSSRLHVIRKPNLRIRQAVRDNNVPLLMRLQHKGDLRNTDKTRLTSLAWAALELSVEVFEWLLLEYGHDDSELSRDADNNNIFHFLAAAPAPPGLSPFTDLLLSDPLYPPRPSARSTPEAIDLSLRMTEVYYDLFRIVDWSNSSGKTPLHYAAQVDNGPFIDLFCDLGADVDLADLQGNTPLHYASAWGHMGSVRVLLERGAQMGSRNLEGFTPADYAYSNSARVAIDNMAREVQEERRARRKEARRLEKEAKDREEHELALAQEQWERQQAERQREREEGRRRAESAGSVSGSDFSSMGRNGGMAIGGNGSLGAGGNGGIGEGGGGGNGEYTYANDLPPDVVAAATAAAQARNDRRGSYRGRRGTPQANGAHIATMSPRAGSPTPQPSRQVSGAVPTLSFVTPTPTQHVLAIPDSNSPSPSPSTAGPRTPLMRPTPPRSPIPGAMSGYFAPPVMRRTDSSRSHQSQANGH